jgi:hypothetical protein
MTPVRTMPIWSSPMGLAGTLLVGTLFATSLPVNAVDGKLVALTWTDVIERQDGQVQLDVLGKGGKRRQVLLPEVVSRSLLSLRGDAGAGAISSSPRVKASTSPSVP